MTDYSEMSDADINLRIAKIMHPEKEFTLAYSFGHPEGPMVQWVQGYAEYLKLDYCNNPADAWPIIETNLISLKPVAMYTGGHKWFARQEQGYEIVRADNNPLRAAMLVFLMMQDAANANSN
jgi:hypothetical protein